MIELGYGYCELDKIHYYSVVDTGGLSLYFNQWLWHFIKFVRTNNIRLLPYHSNDSKIFARYKGVNAKTIAGYITSKIDKHRLIYLDREIKIHG